MRKISNFILILISLVSLNSCGENVSLNQPKGLIVILKADDLGDTTANWNRFIKMISDSSICAGIGIISKKVTSEGSIDEIKRVSILKQANKFPIIEFWNHGYDHSQINGVQEFRSKDPNFQFNHIQLAQDFFSKSLLITCHSFGAPFNETSNLTYLALNKFPEINVWLSLQKHEKQNHSNWKDPNLRIIKANDDHIILNVDYENLYFSPTEKIIYNYKYDKKKEYILIQIHPANWKNESFTKFGQLIHFFKENNRATFMTPYQYYQYLHKNLNGDKI